MKNRLIVVIPGKIMDRICGAHADWLERVYICPDGEPIYECDWTNEELRAHLFPICEFEEIDGQVAFY